MSRKLDVASTLAVLLTCMGLAALGGAAANAEVPMLQARVDAGELPPLAERLPERPEVVTPHESVGTYGGTLRRGLRGSSDYNNLLRVVGPQGLTRWDLNYMEILPNVAESYEIGDGGAVFTFHLRPGMKWSDGQPFTADDILFNMDDLALNEEFAPISPTYMVDGVPVEVEKIDDQTVTFTLAGAVPTNTLPAFAATEAWTANGQAPVACAATEQAWWTRQLHAHAQSDGARGVDLAGSIPALGIAHVTWSDGVAQLVTVAPVDGQWCAVDRLTLR